jgi:hypothetical protein
MLAASRTATGGPAAATASPRRRIAYAEVLPGSGPASGNTRGVLTGSALMGAGVLFVRRCLGERNRRLT